ncbi:hypothetical protein PENSPDRAFT_322188 [Peniophora sp. CONT]|nr:hypothetical protein PENSPDRAFT_322188 [Peniophora sp. CONT]
MAMPDTVHLSELVDFPSRCFINSLPVEVILEIFALVFEAIPRNQRHESKISLTLSHTCRAWRDAALEGKFLWTFIPLVSTCIARLYVERSSPLSFNVQYSYMKFSQRSRYADAFRWLLHDLSRVREMIHADNRDDWAQVVDKRDEWDDTIFDKSTAPLLEALQLVRIENIEMLRSHIFMNSTPRSLRNLGLYYSDLPADSASILFAPALTHLEISFCLNTWTCLAHSLKDLLSLEVLKVAGHDWEECTDLQPFTISESMKVLEISANSGVILSFFRAARIPLRSAVHVSPIDDAGSSQFISRQTFPLMITDLVDAVFSRVTTAFELGITHDGLSIADLGPDSTEIRMWVEPQTELPSLLQAGSIIQYSTTLILAHTRRHRNPELAFGALLISLAQLRTIRPFQSLRKLGLSLELLDEPRHAPVWRVVADSFPQIEEIGLGRAGLVHVLGEANYRDIFPSLTLVILSRGVGVTRSIGMKARQNREGVRFVSVDLLPYFPDHNLPFDDDMD